jgi:ketosteroid isomerase-like protein
MVSAFSSSFIHRDSTMKRTLMVMIGVAALASASSVRAQRASQDVVSEIQAIQNDWARAYQTKDVALLERILGDEYYLYHAGEARSVTKRNEVEGLKTGKTVFTSASNTVREVRQYGEIVVALGEWDAKGTENGKPFSNHDSWQTVFVKRNRTWVAVASHEAPLKK